MRSGSAVHSSSVDAPGEQAALCSYSKYVLLLGRCLLSCLYECFALQHRAILCLPARLAVIVLMTHFK